MVTRFTLVPGTRVQCPCCQKIHQLFAQSWGVIDPETQGLFTAYLLLECGHFVSAYVLPETQRGPDVQELA